jgi:hypothetical protein
MYYTRVRGPRPLMARVRLVGARMRSKLLDYFLYGFGVFIGLQVLWLVVHTCFNDPFMWVFNSTIGGAIMVLGLFVASFLVGLMDRVDISSSFSRAMAFYAGVAVATPIAMYLVSLSGECSNLWPIALVIGWVELAVLVGAGWLIGLGIKRCCNPKTKGQA